MKRESHDARLAQKYLDQVCAWLEEGRPLSDARKAIKAMATAAPAALLAAGLACSGSVEDDDGKGGSGGTRVRRRVRGALGRLRQRHRRRLRRVDRLR